MSGIVISAFFLVSIASAAHAPQSEERAPAISPAQARKYTLTCEASEHRSDGHIPPIPTVRLKATIYLTPYNGVGHLCNEAVNSPEGQQKFRVTSTLEVSIRK